MTKIKNSESGTKKGSLKKGVVVADKMDKTIVVRIDSITRHLLYKKVTTRSIKIKAHDEKNIAKTGDTVTVVQTRPLSKNKVWKLAAIVKKGQNVVSPEDVNK